MSGDLQEQTAQRAERLEMLLAQRAEEQLRYFWRNFTANVSAEAFWGFSWVVTSPTVVLPLYLTSLGASPAFLALLPAVQSLGWGLLQLPGAFFAIRLPRKRDWFLGLHAIPILFWLGIAAVAYWGTALGPRLAPPLSLVGMGAAALTFGALMPMWGDFVNRQMPEHRRGRMFGVAFAVSAASGLAGSTFTARAVEAYGAPRGYAVCFVAAVVAMALGIGCGFFIHEPSSPFPPIRLKVRQYIAHLRQVLARAEGLRRLLLARCVMEAGLMAAPYFAVYGQQKAGLSESEAAGAFVLAATLGNALASPVIGWLGDRHGYKLTLLIGAALGPVALALTLKAQTATVFCVMFALLGGVMFTDWLSAFNLTIELCPDDDKTIYQALYGTLVIPLRLIYPLIASLLVRELGIAAVFRATLAMQLLGVAAAALIVREPRQSGQIG